MASFSGEDVLAGRVISEDDDFMIVEIAKRDDVQWSVEQLPGESKPRFETMLFCSFKDGDATFEKPWERV